MRMCALRGRQEGREQETPHALLSLQVETQVETHFTLLQCASTHTLRCCMALSLDVSDKGCGKDRRERKWLLQRPSSCHGKKALWLTAIRIVAWMKRCVSWRPLSCFLVTHTVPSLTCLVSALDMPSVCQQLCGVVNLT